MQPLKVGICGLGTVGGGTFNVLQRNGAEIARRIGREIQVVQIAARDLNPSCDTTGIPVTDDVYAVVNNPEIDIVVELIGGVGLAKELVLAALKAGKHVVTANKALIAMHGNEIFATARENEVMVGYEASVAGGIPIMKSLREGLAANRINWVAGIINGTGNFILTEMTEKGRAFDDVLKEAQALGYAEADPTFDVEGIDAAHKLVILAANAFGMPLYFDRVFTQGISQVQTQDIRFAAELGYAVKHLGIARRSAAGVELRVHPTLIPRKKLLGQVNGVMNAVMVNGDAVGDTLYYGAGAGDEPTASAVIADLADLGRALAVGAKLPSQAFQPEAIEEQAVLPIGAIRSSYYLRIQAFDRPGVMSGITQILSSNGINIEAVIQKEHDDDDSAETTAAVIMLTHKVQEAAIDKAIAEIEARDDTEGSVVKLRVDHLDNK